MTKPTAAEIASACYSYRHDFGLLDEEERTQIAAEAAAWFRAWSWPPAPIKPSGPVMIALPIELPAEVLRAIRSAPLTSCEDRDEMNTRIGWLLCAWDVIKATAPSPD